MGDPRVYIVYTASEISDERYCRRPDVEIFNGKIVVLNVFGMGFPEDAVCTLRLARRAETSRGSPAGSLYISWAVYRLVAVRGRGG